MFGILNYCRVHSLESFLRWMTLYQVRKMKTTEENIGRNHCYLAGWEEVFPWDAKSTIHKGNKLIKLTLKETRMLTPKVKNTQFIQTCILHLQEKSKPKVAQKMVPWNSDM